jgi:hypothetical protein
MLGNTGSFSRVARRYSLGEIEAAVTVSKLWQSESVIGIIREGPAKSGQLTVFLKRYVSALYPPGIVVLILLSGKADCGGGFKTAP